MGVTLHQAGMEKQLLSQLSPPLAQALEQIAQSLPADFDRQASGIPAFFHNFMDGFWTPFEEVCQSDTEGLRKADQTIRALEHSLVQSLTEKQRKRLDQFCDALNARNTEELECAFLVGYQTAVRLTLMGLFPLNTLFQRETPHEG